MQLGSSLVEIHCHVLAGVDDGPATIRDSLDLIRAAAEEGTDTIVATPHVRPDFMTDVFAIGEHVEELRIAVAAAEIDVELLAGGELAHTLVGRLAQAELERLAQGPADRRWLLVETPFEGIGEDLHLATEELRDRGFGVVLAHPERSADATLDGFAGLDRELESGSLVQVNAGSVLGLHGAAARGAAWSLIERGLVAAISSDAHGPTRGPLLLSAWRELLAGNIEPSHTARLVASGPRGLLARGVPVASRSALLV